MGIELEVLHEGRVVLVKFPRELDLVEYTKVVKKAHVEMYDHATQPIHAILDLSDVRGLPRNVLSHAISITKLRHRMDGMIIIVANHGIVNRMLELLLRFSKSPYYMHVHSRAEALDKVTAILNKEKESQKGESDSDNSAQAAGAKV